MITIEAQLSGMNQAYAALNRIYRVLDTKKDDMAVEALHKAARVWEHNFATEGGDVGGWAKLAERTQEERERLGFVGGWPILQRYGHLMRLTTTNLLRARQTGSWSNSEGGNISVSVYTHDGHMQLTAQGNKAMNQERAPNRPPRPYWFVNGQVSRDVRQGVVDWLTDELRGV